MLLMEKCLRASSFPIFGCIPDDTSSTLIARLRYWISGRDSERPEETELFNFPLPFYCSGIEPLQPVDQHSRQILPVEYLILKYLPMPPHSQAKG